MQTVTKYVSFYTLLALVVGAQGATLLFVHRFGNTNVDYICGAILSGLAVLSIIGHGFLQSLMIPIPGGVYTELQTLNGVFTTLLTSSGIIVQYVGTVSSSLTPWVTLIIQGLALLSSLLAGLFKVTVVKKEAMRLAAAA